MDNFVIYDSYNLQNLFSKTKTNPVIVFARTKNSNYLFESVSHFA